MKKALEFVELQTFTKRFHNAGITDEQLRYLQNELIDNPLKGKLIRGTGGLRKVRLKAIEGKGKSGGGRAIYLLLNNNELVLFLYFYTKQEEEEMTAEEKKDLKRIVQNIKGGAR